MAKSKPLPRHILVLRLSAMGDVAMLPYAVDALSKAYPDVKITVVTRPEFKPFFANTNIEFFPADIRHEYKGVRGLFAISKALKKLGADAFADEHDVLRSIFLRTAMRLHGLRVAKIDKGHAEKREALKNRGNDIQLKHTVERYCDTFRKLGFDVPSPRPVVKAAREKDWGGVSIGFAPFSAHRGKSCPDQLRREITRLLSRRFDRVFIHGGSGAEADFAREMEQTYPNVEAVFGKVDGLGGEMELISKQDCMVSMDSLAMHLASLTGTPVVSIWGATHPKLGFLGYGCDPEGVVQADLKCRPCSTYGNRECRFGTYRCLSEISAEEVVDRVERITAKHAAAI